MARMKKVKKGRGRPSREQLLERTLEATTLEGNELFVNAYSYAMQYIVNTLQNEKAPTQARLSCAKMIKETVEEIVEQIIEDEAEEDKDSEVLESVNKNTGSDNLVQFVTNA